MRNVRYTMTVSNGNIFLRYMCAEEIYNYARYIYQWDTRNFKVSIVFFAFTLYFISAINLYRIWFSWKCGIYICCKYCFKIDQALWSCMYICMYIFCLSVILVIFFTCVFFYSFCALRLLLLSLDVRSPSIAITFPCCRCGGGQKKKKRKERTLNQS